MSTAHDPGSRGLEGPDRLRLFAAVVPPTGVLESVTRCQGTLRRLFPDGWRWVPPSHLHLTLVFYGQVSPDQVPDLVEAGRQAVSAIKVMEVRLGDTGFFPARGRPRVLWLGLEGDLHNLRRMQGALSVSTRAWVERWEDRDYQPHLTLARAAGRGGGELSGVKPSGIPRGPGPVSWYVDEVCLMRSDPGSHGPVYSRLASWRLAG